MKDLARATYNWMCRIHCDGPMSVQVYWHSHTATTGIHAEMHGYMVNPHDGYLSRWSRRLEQLHDDDDGVSPADRLKKEVEASAQ